MDFEELLHALLPPHVVKISGGNANLIRTNSIFDIQSTNWQIFNILIICQNFAFGIHIPHGLCSGIARGELHCATEFRWFHYIAQSENGIKYNSLGAFDRIQTTDFCVRTTDCVFRTQIFVLGTKICVLGTHFWFFGPLSQIPNYKSLYEAN